MHNCLPVPHLLNKFIDNWVEDTPNYGNQFIDKWVEDTPNSTLALVDIFIINLGTIFKQLVN